MKESKKAQPDMSESRRARRQRCTKPGEKRRICIQWRPRPAERPYVSQNSKAWELQPACIPEKERRVIRTREGMQRATVTREAHVAESAHEAKISDRHFSQKKPIFTNSRPRCCELPSRGGRAPTANHRITPWRRPHSGVGGGQKRTTES